MQTTSIQAEDHRMSALVERECKHKENILLEGHDPPRDASAIVTEINVGMDSVWRRGGQSRCTGELELERGKTRLRTEPSLCRESREDHKVRDGRKVHEGREVREVVRS